MVKRLTPEEKRWRALHRARPGEGIKRSGARLSIGFDWDDEFTQKEYIRVILWPGKLGSRKVHLGRISLPMSREQMNAFVAECVQRMPKSVDDSEVVAKLRTEILERLEENVAVTVPVIIGPANSEYVDRLGGFPMSAALRKFLES